MQGMGGLRDKASFVDALMSSGSGPTKQVKEKETDKENYNIQKGVRLCKRQNNNLSDLKIALETKNDGEALRWALDKVFELEGEKIREIAEKKKGMSLQ
jgi:hypothetical protein